MPASHGFARIFQILGQRNYGTFTLGNSISLIGTWMQRIASGWLAWTLTESAGWVGAIAFADLFPCILIGPFAGAAADRWDRLRVLKIGQLLGFGQAFLLAILYAMDVLTIWPLFLITLFNGFVTGGLQPFRLSITPRLVEPQWLTTAIAINSVNFNLARFVGPAAAGLIIATGGMGWTFALNALSYLVFVVALGFVRLRPQQIARSGKSFGADIVIGLKHAVTMPGVNAILLMTVVSGICVRPVLELLPGWAAQAFHGSSSDFAALTSAFGIGAIVGGLWLATREGTRGLAGIVVWSNIGMCATLLCFAASTRIWMALPLAMLTGSCMVSAAVSGQTLVQTLVPDELRGRVLSVLGLVMRGSPAIGALLLGVASDHFGMRLPLITGVAVLLGLMLYFVVGFARFRAVLEDGY
ncbi:MFS transporter [Pseudooceanicola sp. LIPI14-2-Ac024]|uniref:MFS transporter n=1 Tax=Pseudooceanicola sp. LIPI14-2-Ac024 TaxID=3344875 RepID=UPI0035D06863